MRYVAIISEEAQGVRKVDRLIALIESEASDLPATARASIDMLAGTLTELNRQIGVLDAEIDRRAQETHVVRRLLTTPGIGPLIATLAPPPEIFRKERNFAAWLGRTPRQHSTVAKQMLVATTKMSDRSLRRLIYGLPPFRFRCVAHVRRHFSRKPRVTCRPVLNVVCADCRSR